MPPTFPGHGGCQRVYNRGGAPASTARRIDKESVMATKLKSQVNRRGFLRGAAAGAAGAAALAVPGVAPVAANTVAESAAPSPPAASPLTPEQAAQSLATETAPLPDDPGTLTVQDPGSDFMVDVLKTLGFEYVASNPASSFRGLHESLINYGGNSSPEWLTVCHEEASVNMANGYYAVAGKPMAVVTFAPSGLHHATMGIFGAFSGRSPTYLLCANIADGKERRPVYDWGAHSVVDPAGMVRDMLKWDDAPGSLQHFAESAVRAYKMAMTEPRGPVMLVVDATLQESPVVDRSKLHIPKLALTSPPAGEPGAVTEAARLLVAAENPLIIAGDVARDEEGMRLLVELAETLQAPVQGGGRGMPNQHPLSGGGNVRTADVILALNEDGLYGRFHQVPRSAGEDVRAPAQTWHQGDQHQFLRLVHALQLPECRAISGGHAGTRRGPAGNAPQPHRGLQETDHRRSPPGDGRTREATGGRVGPSARACACGGDLRLGRQSDHIAATGPRGLGRDQRERLGIGWRQRRAALGRGQVLSHDGQRQRRWHRRIAADRHRRRPCA